MSKYTTEQLKLQNIDLKSKIRQEEERLEKINDSLYKLRLKQVSLSKQIEASKSPIKEGDEVLVTIDNQKIEGFVDKVEFCRFIDNHKGYLKYRVLRKKADGTPSMNYLKSRYILFSEFEVELLKPNKHGKEVLS